MSLVSPAWCVKTLRSPFSEHFWRANGFETLYSTPSEATSKYFRNCKIRRNRKAYFGSCLIFTGTKFRMLLSLLFFSKIYSYLPRDNCCQKKKKKSKYRLNQGVIYSVLLLRGYETLLFRYYLSHISVSQASKKKK